ncbi:MAG TPA: sigma-54 dependent transcriptional regulator [Nitrospirales bacterium]|nr:sigma-54-dependent Fis family transcriptional regulator [Nitrospiraceae bacterium]HNP30660.1 sigma-54 dependent transcriptional regulator [Nitrospirales bacterium]
MEETILLIESEPAKRKALLSCLSKDYQVLTATTGKHARQVLVQIPAIGVILFDDGIPDVSSVEFFQEIRVLFPDVVRVLLSDSGDEQAISDIMKREAVYQVVPKSIPPWHLLLLVNRALESRELSRRHRFLSRELKISDSAFRSPKDGLMKLIRESYEFGKLVFASDSMLEVCNLAKRGAPTDLPVLIEGETGTGKELMAQAIHGFSDRKGFPFLTQNCGALPDDLLYSELFGHKRGAFTGAVSDRLGLFSAADGGTVFLDEISEVSPTFQVSLLRFLQEGEIKPLGTEQTKHANVRILAASNQPIKEAVKEGKFRQDLYFRLRGFEILIPPLRDRPEDIPVLAEYLSRKYSESLNRKIAGISVQVMHHLQAYLFPGNVRELETEIHRMVSLAGDGEFLTIEHLSPEITRALPSEDRIKDRGHANGGRTLKEKVERLEARIVSQSLIRHRWNQSKVAKELGLSRVGLANKIKRYNLYQATH